MMKRAAEPGCANTMVVVEPTSAATDRRAPTVRVVAGDALRTS
jgi:hypothetical protein